MYTNIEHERYIYLIIYLHQYRARKIIKSIKVSKVEKKSMEILPFLSPQRNQRKVLMKVNHKFFTPWNKCPGKMEARIS